MNFESSLENKHQLKTSKISKNKEKITNNMLVEFKKIRWLHQDWSSHHTDQTHRPAKRTPLSIAKFCQRKRSIALLKIGPLMTPPL